MIGIYKITNMINNKNYIGQSINITERIASHKRQAFYMNMYFTNYPLYKAIRKYGLENFNFTILEECSSDKLNEREIFWIQAYNSFGPQGYNMTPGGAGIPKVIPEQVIQLFQEGYQIPELIDMFDCAESTITIILHKAGLGLMAQDEKNKLQPNCKAVEQYTLDGKYIATYYSLGAASAALYSLGVLTSSNTRDGKSSISQACHTHGRAYNYLWKFVEDSTDMQLVAIQVKEKEKLRREHVGQATLKRCAKEVNQYNLSGKYIQTFPSVVAAGQFFNTSHGPIARVCRGEGKVSHGYLWKYVSEEYPKGQNLNLEGG